ncbi:MAG: SBBP repeat-containing protein, partial [Ignavibacteria bacterium]
GSYFDYCTIKYNSNGVQQWVQYYDGPGHGIDQAEEIAVDKVGNIYVTGFSSQVGNNFDYATIKYSPDGRELWVRRYGPGGPATYVNGMAVDDICNVYITGWNNTNAVTIKYDSSGTQLWVKTYSGIVGGTGANSIALDKYNNVYITGFSFGLYTWRDYFTIKYSSSGVWKWVRRFSIDSTIYSTSIANSIAVDDIGNIYVSGFTSLNAADPRKITTLRYTNSGDLIWVQRDTAVLSNESSYMVVDNNNNIYVSGSTSNLPNYSSYTTIKYDSGGLQQWREKYNFQSGNSEPSCLKVDKEFNVFVTGRAGGNMGTIKYSQPVGIININNQIPKNYKLNQNYPNPFNPITRIRFELPKATFVKILIYDVLGREVYTLINGNINVGAYEVVWNAG